MMVGSDRGGVVLNDIKLLRGSNTFCVGHNAGHSKDLEQQETQRWSSTTGAKKRGIATYWIWY